MRAVWVGFILCLASATALADKAREPGWVRVDRIIAVVNQDVILESDVARRTAGIPTGPGQPPRAEIEKQVLEAMIDEVLFMQEASRQGITVTDRDVEGAIVEVKKQNQLDDAGLAKALEANGYTLETYREEMRRQLLHLRALTVVIRPRISLADEEVAAAYREAKKADPKLGTFEAEKDRVRQRLFEARMAGEAKKWLAERRLVSYIAVRA